MAADISAALDSYRAFADPTEGTADNPFRLACFLDGPATPQEIHAAWPFTRLSDDLEALWTTSRESRLFVDIDYGQWGLVLLAPASAAERTTEQHSERPGEYETGDVVIGEFLGDQELLVLADGGQILIALPLDERSAWYVSAHSLTHFLERYLAARGGKFWEVTLM